ncbi:hypothetical protein [Colwellia sp. TT2012]|uniref:hypothetical protein n=1 Tax=Colwellia sp. TT2012 TaxID=1720342 RepID=UPI000710322E|nr:hypothetical protein [Colwellia sp. TT2012]
MYFWENSPERANAYGIELKEARKKLKDPMVIGAVIHLGRCFNLLEAQCLSVLKANYESMKSVYALLKLPLPTNETAYTGDSDKLFRKLDCAVIQYMHCELLKQNEKPFDTVRAAFWEGDSLYPDAGFKEKNHIQLCVINPNSIKGYFRPLIKDEGYASV